MAAAQGLTLHALGRPEGPPALLRPESATSDSRHAPSLRPLREDVTASEPFVGADPEVSRGRSPRPSVVAGWSVEPESPVPRPSDGVGGRGVGVAEAAARSRPCRVLSRLWRSRVLLCAPGQVVPDAGARRPWPGRRAAAARVGVPRETAEAAQERGVGPGWSVSSGASDYPPVRGGAGPARRPGRRPTAEQNRAQSGFRGQGRRSARVRELLPPPPDTHAPGSALRSSRCSLRALRLGRSAALGRTRPASRPLGPLALLTWVRAAPADPRHVPRVRSGRGLGQSLLAATRVRAGV